MENLKEFGLPTEFRTLSCTADASKLRVCATVAQDAKDKYSQLMTDQLGTLQRPFGEWHKRCYYKILHDNSALLHSNGISVPAVLARGGLSAQQGWRTDRGISFQKAARELIKKRFCPFNLEERVRHKLDRWVFRDLPGRICRRICPNFRLLNECCRPYVTSAYLRALWNGWPTSARMRTLADITVHSCAFGCLSPAQDSIEHYALCPAGWQFFRMRRPHGLGLSEGLRSLYGFCRALEGMSDDDKLAVAIGI